MPPKPSKLDIAKHKGHVLDQIMATKRDEVPRRMAVAPLSQVKAFAALAPPPLDFVAALGAPGLSLIAEVKRASPSRGLIAKEWDPELIAETYARNGAAAISCLTDKTYFQGDLEHLTAIKEHLRAIGKSVPVLRKEFIYHEYQVHEARMAGADAILLIVAVLGDSDLRRLHALATSLGMAVLVEVHDEEEVKRALSIGPRILGVNNRNLKTFEVDIETTGRLRALIPPDMLLVAESGIGSSDEVARLAAMDCDAMLVGETFCRLPQAQRANKVQQFVQAGRQRAAH
jgi:indole-3-glycerol phosphate synthase